MTNEERLKEALDVALEALNAQYLHDNYCDMWCDHDAHSKIREALKRIKEIMTYDDV